MRRVRRVTAYACTACFKIFPTSRMAKEHAKEHPAPKPVRAGAAPRRVKQTDLVLQAVAARAKTAEAIHKKTKIPLDRVHSLLSYHRRRGNIVGYTGSLQVGPKAR
jgi:hypothetical protein